MIRAHPESTLFPTPPLFRSEVLVDAVNGSILFRHNHVLNDSYKVYAWPSESPNHVRTGQPVPPADGRETVTDAAADAVASDRKSTRLNSSHANISYAVFCLK